MAKKTLGIVLFAVFAMMAMSAQGVMAGPVQTLTACLKEEPQIPLGTAVYSLWDNDRSRLEITVAGVTVDGTYCIFINQVLLPDTQITVVDGAGSLTLDTNWGDEIPLIVSGWKISLKSCDTDNVLCGMFK